MEELAWVEMKDESARIYHFPGGQKFGVNGVVRICVWLMSSCAAKGAPPF